MDVRFFTALHKYAGKSKTLDALGVFCAEILPFLMIAIITLFSFSSLSPYNWTLFAKVSASIGIAVLVARALKILFGTQRPISHDTVISSPLVKSKVVHAFPSGHSSVAFAIATSVFFATTPTIGVAFFIMAIFVSLGRVFVGVHWPSDIIGGAFIGILSAVSIHFIIYKLT